MRPRAVRSLRAARALHRGLLVLAPRSVVRAYRAEMIETFEAASEAAATKGPLAVWTLLLREAVDVATVRRANRPARLVVPNAGGDAAPGGEWRRTSAWRQAWRALVRRPAFLSAAVLTLAVGTAITTAVFSLVDTVLIKPLPYPESDRLVAVYESSSSARERTSLIAPVRLDDWHRLNRTFAGLSGSYTENVTDTSAEEPERLAARRVMPRFFAVYGMAPLAGRWFVPAEEEPGGPGAVVISERFWARRFNRDPGAVGYALTIGGRSHPIVGIMPAAFTDAATDAWLPAQISKFLMGIRGARFMVGIGRLRPGVSVQAGAHDLASVQAALAREFPASDAGWSVEVTPLKQWRVGSSRRGLVLLFGAVASLWLVAIANVAGLTLVQMHRRSRELAIRAALGASRARVVGTVAREGLLIAIAGGVLGAVLASWLVAAMPVVLRRTPRIVELALDWRALAFAAATSALAAGVFSLVPALTATRSRLGAAAGRHIAAGRHRLQQALVIAQVALSVLLVGSATLLLRSYHNLTQVETGFDSSNVVTFHVGARWDEDRTRVGQLQEQLIARLEELPHVQAAGLTNFLPATGATLRYQVTIEGLKGSNEDGSITVGARMMGGSYLPAMRARLISGGWCRPLSLGDKGARLAIVNQQFVDANAPGQNLVGRTLRTWASSTPLTIAGVVGNLAEDGHATSAVPYVYTCDQPGSWPDPEYVVRTSDARALAVDLRRIVRELDPGRAVFGFRPLQEVLDAALDQPRLDAAILGFFAVAAVTLAAIGLYSLFMLVVAERGREMAVRLAIGAAPRQLIGLVMASAGRLLAAGIVLGVALTATADRVLRGLLFGVSPLDAGALASAALVLAVVCTIAIAGPARRASRIAPIEALKGE